MRTMLPTAADEAAHEAVLELIKTNNLSSPGIASAGTGEKIADNLIALHKKLAAYYQELGQDD